MSQPIGLNIAKLLSSKIASQTLMLISTPVITRLFVPEHFGIVQLFESIAAPLFIIAGLRYEQSIPLGRDHQEASASFVLSLFFMLNMTVFSLVAVLVGKDQLARWFHVPELAGFLWFLPVYIALFGLHNALSYWASREGKFGIMAWADLGETVGGKTVTIAWGGLLGTSAAGLLLGRFAGILTTVVVLLGSLGKSMFTVLQKARITFAILRNVALRHKKFPLFSTWTALFASLTFQLPSLLCGLYFSPTVVGYYSLAHRVVSLLSVFLGTVIAQVFFPMAAQEYHTTGTLSPIVDTTFKRLVQLGVFPMVLLAGFGGVLFRVIFGQQWIEAGLYAQILAPWHFLIFLNLSLDIFPLTNRQELGLLLALVSLLIRAMGLLIGAAIGSPRVTLGLFVCLSVVFLSGQLFWKLRLCGVSLLKNVKILFSYLLLACLLLGPAKWLSWMFNDFKIDMMTILFAATGYATVLLIREPSLRALLVTMIGKVKGVALKKRC